MFRDGVRGLDSAWRCIYHVISLWKYERTKSYHICIQVSFLCLSTGLHINEGLEFTVCNEYAGAVLSGVLSALWTIRINVHLLCVK